MARQVEPTRGGGDCFAWGDVLFLQDNGLLPPYLVLFFSYLLVYCITKMSWFVIAKRLLREVNVVVILVLSLCNWSIDITRPATSISPILGLIYLVLVTFSYFWTP